jgi:Pentapeptide repeats (8 copies)
MTNIFPTFVGPAFFALGAIVITYDVMSRGAFWIVPLRYPKFYILSIAYVALAAVVISFYSLPVAREAQVERARNQIARNHGFCHQDLGAREGYETLASLGFSLEKNDLDCGEFTGISLPAETNLRWASLAGANLQNAKLGGTMLAGTIVSAGNLSGADLTRATFSYAIIGSHVLYERAGAAHCYAGASLEGANLTQTDLLRSYLKGVRGLTCNQLTKAKNWEQTVRDNDLACGAEIPSFPLYDYIKTWPIKCGQ